MRLINPRGEQLGVVDIRVALDKAREQNCDLVEVNPNSRPPVCCIVDYGKFVYEKSKTTRRQRKNQKIIQVKEIKFRPTIDREDYLVKLRNLVKFLEQGNKIRVVLKFRGREITHKEIGMRVLDDIQQDLNDLANVESPPGAVEGRQLAMVLVPKK